MYKEYFFAPNGKCFNTESDRIIQDEYSVQM